MKTPDHRPRFQSATRHYHRYREDRRDWADWIDPVKKSSAKRRGWWLAALAVLGMAAVIGTVWYQVP